MHHVLQWVWTEVNRQVNARARLLVLLGGDVWALKQTQKLLLNQPRDNLSRRQSGKKRLFKWPRSRLELVFPRVGYAWVIGSVSWEAQNTGWAKCSEGSGVMIQTLNHGLQRPPTRAFLFLWSETFIRRTVGVINCTGRGEKWEALLNSNQMQMNRWPQSLVS